MGRATIPDISSEPTPCHPARWLRLICGVCSVGLVCLVHGCSGQLQEQAPSGTAVASLPLHFEFVSPDGQTLVAERLRGRVTVVLLVASYDFASQLMARQLQEVARSFTPRINAGAVVMEPPAYAELKGTFQQTLGLDYSVVMADHATLEGRGPFGEVQRIPATIILDPLGRERTRLYGAVERSTLEAALRAARD